MFDMENRGETLIFMSRHFDHSVSTKEWVAILILPFLCFGARTIFYRLLFCDKNKEIYDEALAN